jgi:hypothetical protein
MTSTLVILWVHEYVEVSKSKGPFLKNQHLYLLVRNQDKYGVVGNSFQRTSTWFIEISHKGKDHYNVVF